VFGTKNIVDASLAAGVERFVLVSTDKAVDPNSVYGASKLIAEELVLRQGTSDRVFLVVRFGNVLGSRGSILPLFRQQILKGGPVTITDPQSKRYFMTIPEAVSLVLQAGGVGHSRGLYLLDMGEPVSIKELADQMVRFYGYDPDNEIRVMYTGLRPGEKLEERLWSNGDEAKATKYPKILKLDRHYALNGQLGKVIDRLNPICYFDTERSEVYRNRKALRHTLKEIVPTLRMPEDEPPH
jgi:FlaA1/EpsC-like NDP-sugar epimerase